MASYYTQFLLNNPDLGLKEFLLHCTPILGIFSRVRDHEGPLPEKFVPDTISGQQAAVEEAELAKLLTLSDDEILQREADRDVEAERLTREKQVRAENANKVFNAMKRKVKAWEAPTREHEDLKQFVLNEINDAMRPVIADRPARGQRSASELRSNWISSLAASIQRLHAEQEAEKRSVTRMNHFLTDLLRSLA